VRGFAAPPFAAPPSLTTNFNNVHVHIYIHTCQHLTAHIFLHTALQVTETKSGEETLEVSFVDTIICHQQALISFLKMTGLGEAYCIRRTAVLPYSHGQAEPLCAYCVCAFCVLLLINLEEFGFFFKQGPHPRVMLPHELILTARNLYPGQSARYGRNEWL